MARINLDLPTEFHFSTSIPIRITDVNYGGHVGNDTVLSLIHEARAQFFKSHSYEELNIEGIGLIMSDVAIEFKSELFYGDIVRVSIAAENFTTVAFDLYYKLEKPAENLLILVAIAKTGMVSYDYTRKKIVAFPIEAKSRITR